MRHAILAVMLLGVLSACSQFDGFWGQPELTSPCVGLDDSPCGPKREVNKDVS
jgi:hypothetical protein